MARHLESQLDFIFFFYGLSFILLGALCLVLARGQDDDRGATIRWIGLFGCVHGANEWLDMLALIAGDGTEFMVVRTVVLIVSFMLLAEAGRKGGETHGLPMPGPWIYIPIFIGLGAIGFVDGLASAKAAARYLLAAPGAVLVAFTAFTGRNDDIRINRPLMVGVTIAFAGYAVAAGMIVEFAPFWPANSFNQETFLRVSGVAGLAAASGAAPEIAATCWSIRSNAASIASRSIPATSRWPLSIAATCWSSRSQIRESAPHSRKVEATSLIARAPRCAATRVAVSSSVAIALATLARASPITARIAASDSTAASAWACFCAARVCSIRATASSTMLVSALRLRLAYSVRNQRPREVSMKASRIAS